ncbi:thioesterase family protein [Naumannella halotolerans]|nr:thioesterase family protein [Naumannella halotolerans]
MSEPMIWSEPIRPDWIDYNGHLSEAFYVLIMGNATDSVLSRFGMGPQYPGRTGSSVYTVENHVRYLAEVRGADAVEVRSSVIGANRKLIWLWHELWAGERLRATMETLGVHVTDGASSAFPPEIAEQLRAAVVPPPAEASGRIRPIG